MDRPACTDQCYSPVACGGFGYCRNLNQLQVSVTWRNDNPNTIWNRLAARLGRKPTSAEATAEVKRILAEARVPT